MTGFQGQPGSARARDLAELILAGLAADDPPAGGRLPTERQLAAELGVTRTAVRHALGLLEARGLVSREVGRGTFLLDGRPQEEALFEVDVDGEGEPADVGPGDVMTARQAIEPQIVPLVVAWATARDFEELDRCIAGGEGAGNAEEFEAWDFALHHALVLATHNALLVRMYAAIEAARRGALWGNLKLKDDSGERRAAYQSDHVAIVRALRAREIEHAVALTNQHLERVRLNLLRAAG